MFEFRIESYSCKMAGDFKKSYKQMHDEKTGSSPNDLQILGAPNLLDKLGVSPTLANSNMNTYFRSSSLNEADLSEYSKSCNATIDIISRKTLFYLISTLNASFQPDYDFTNSSSSEFSKEPSFEFVVKSVENFLGTVDAYTRAKQQIWDAIDKEIIISDCEFYR